MLSADWRSPAAIDCRLHRHDICEAEPGGHAANARAVVGPVLEQIAEMTIKIKQYELQIKRLAVEAIARTTGETKPSESPEETKLAESADLTMAGFSPQSDAINRSRRPN